MRNWPRFFRRMPSRDSNPRPLDRQSDALPQCHDAIITITVITTVVAYTPAIQFLCHIIKCEKGNVIRNEVHIIPWTLTTFCRT